MNESVHVCVLRGGACCVSWLACCCPGSLSGASPRQTFQFPDSIALSDTKCRFLQLASVEDFQVPPGKQVIKVGANECLECEGVNKDGGKCVRLVTIKDVAKYGGRIMCWQHR